MHESDFDLVRQLNGDGATRECCELEGSSQGNCGYYYCDSGSDSADGSCVVAFILLALLFLFEKKERHVYVYVYTGFLRYISRNPLSFKLKVKVQRDVVLVMARSSCSKLAVDFVNSSLVFVLASANTFVSLSLPLSLSLFFTPPLFCSAKP